VAWAVGPNLLALVVSWLWALYARFEVKDARLLNSLSLAGALRRSALDWFRYLRQTIGVLGWVDTYLPFFVYAAWFAALVLIIAMHLRTATSRGIAALGVLVAGLLALPLIINGFTNSRAGLTFQGRYSLPLFAGLVFLPTWSQRSTRRLRIVAQQWLIAAVLALVVVAEIGAFWQTLRRFTVGANAKVVLTGPLSWSPAVAPMLLIAINGVAMVAAAWSAWRSWGGAVAVASDDRGVPKDELLLEGG
jgi:hypothetical protein